VCEAGPAAGERALMRAVLEDAVRCLVGEVGPRRQRGQLAAEAREWIEAGDFCWPFSFENVCDGLGFHAASLRGRLLRDAPALAARFGLSRIRIMRICQRRAEAPSEGRTAA